MAMSSPQPQHIPLYLTVEQVAQIMGCSKDSVRRSMRNGALPYVQLTPRIRRIPRTALENLPVEGMTAYATPRQ